MAHANIHAEFDAVGISFMNCTNSLLCGRGRPFGGKAILWSKRLCDYVKPVTPDGETCVMGIEFVLHGVKYLIEMYIHHILAHPM